MLLFRSESQLDKMFDSLYRMNTYKPISNSVYTKFDNGVCTTTIDAAGADRTKFDIHISNKNNLVIRYDGSDGFRCRPFHYYVPLGNYKVENTEATYVDGVLTVTVRAAENEVRKIQLN